MLWMMIIVVVVALRVFLLLLLLFASGRVSPVGLGLQHQGIVRALGGIDTGPVNNRRDSEL
jgi:hypothetical protein